MPRKTTQYASSSCMEREIHSRAGNDLQDFLHASFPMDANSPQGRYIAALIDFDKPLIAAVHGAAVGSGTTTLMHCDFVYAAENAVFQMPFINLALVPELGTSYSVPAQIGYIAAAELFLLGAAIRCAAGGRARSCDTGGVRPRPHGDSDGDGTSLGGKAHRRPSSFQKAAEAVVA